MPIYDDLIRRVVNEINVAGKQIDNENDDNDNFMDDDAPAQDTAPAPEPTADDAGGGDDDDVGAGEDDNFMDDDGGDAGTDDAGSGDDDDVGAGEDDNFMDDDGGDDTGETGGDDMGTDDDDVGAGEDDNFMDDGGDDTGSDDTGSDDTSDDSGEGDSENGEEDYDLDKIEDELFSSLTPEQIAIKNHELKNQFIELYSLIGTTLVRINDIPKSNDNVNILKFITEKLLELREMIDYNITTAYPTRTYIENNIIYQQCIATVNTIADILDNIPNVNGGESNKEKEEEDKKDDLGEPVVPDETETHSSLDLSDINVSDYREESANYNSLF